MDTQKVPRGMDKSMVVVGMPLSAIIQDQLENSYCPVATLSMGAELKGTSCMPEGEPALKSEKKTISEDDILSGNFLILLLPWSKSLFKSKKVEIVIQLQIE